MAATTLTALGKEDAAFTALERSMAAAAKGDDPHLETVGSLQPRMGAHETGSARGRRTRGDDRRRAHGAGLPLPARRAGAVGHPAAPRSHGRGPPGAAGHGAGAALHGRARPRRGSARTASTTQRRSARPTWAWRRSTSRWRWRRVPRRCARPASVPELHALPPTWRARFHVDRALAFADLNKDDGALQALLTAERDRPGVDALPLHEPPPGGRSPWPRAPADVTAHRPRRPAPPRRVGQGGHSVRVESGTGRHCSSSGRPA